MEHPPLFPKYDGEKGNAREHIARYLEAMSPWLTHDETFNGNLLMREFSKSLTDAAYTWYCNMEPGTIKDWNDMKFQFHKKFFNVQKRVSMVELVRMSQAHDEELSNYVLRFREAAQQCTDPIEEKNLVSMCANGASADYKAHLITKGCKTFSDLGVFAQEIEGVIPKLGEAGLKIIRQRGEYVDEEEPFQKRLRDDPPPPITLEEEAFKDLVQRWMSDGTLHVKEPKKPPTEEMKSQPDYCMFHQYLGHSTMDCLALRKKFQKVMREE
jgi:hypothetical protein